MNTRQRFCILLISLVVLSGCWDARNLELMYFAHTVCYDYKDGQFEVYAQILNFQAMPGGGEGTQDGGSMAFVGVGKGTTPVEALHELFTHTDRRIFWGHLSSIVFTEQILQQKDSIEKIYDSFSRYDENRHTIWVFGTTTDPAELLTTPTLLNMSPIFSFLGEPTESHQQSSLVEPLRLHRFISLLNEPGYTATFPVLDTIDEKWFEEEKKPNKSLKIVGGGFFNEGQFIGNLLGEDLQGFPWMNEGTVRRALVIKINEQLRGSVIIRDPKPKIIPTIKNDQVTFNIEVEVIANPIEVFEEITIPEVEKEVARLIEKEIRHTFEKGVEINADVFQLAHTLYKKDPELYRKHTQGPNSFLTPETLNVVNVNVKVLKSGKDKLKSIN
ncbi:Ger(x)C family spore germination protein [Alkalihalobacterium alkalinitrilicum]|uniref:Ger(x)C family spore germination protein n=1 Tax=Alkalihalobacterium alkalinitrilicum TaxID=427920 RepID=UPI000995ABD7|nr:Ger(x)C family spore germination protein [Alkalihalobacterium alkalinitrilicum]